MKECNSCGKCCTLYGDGGLSATTGEIEWWEVFRPEIYEYVSNGKIWMNPTNGDQLKQCPWLQKQPHSNKYTCGIYNDRPDDCKHYPVTIAEMVRDGCEMLDVVDLSNPAKAQHKLDKLMSDSRPALT